MPITEINPVEFQLDQLEQQYGIPKSAPQHNGRSYGTSGYGGNICHEVVLEETPEFVSPGVFFREPPPEPQHPEPQQSIMAKIFSSEILS